MDYWALEIYGQFFVFGARLRLSIVKQTLTGVSTSCAAASYIIIMIYVYFRVAVLCLKLPMTNVYVTEYGSYYLDSLTAFKGRAWAHG